MAGINHWRKWARVLLMVGLALILVFSPFNQPGAEAARKGAAALKEAGKASVKISAGVAETSPPEAIQELREVLEVYQPQVTIVSPKPDELIADDTVSVRFQVKDLPIFKDEKLGLGPHLHVFLDNQPYQAVYNPNTPLLLSKLEPGTHTLRVFASRPWHESFKNDGAYAQTTFHIFTKTQENVPSRDLPLLTYSRPQGTYGAEPIMLDFYLTNAPLHLVAQENDQDDIADWRIRCTVNGNSFVLDRWQPIYLKGFKPGKNWVQLEFLDDKGNPVRNVFNNTARVITYDPNGNDTLAKLVRGDLSAKAARGIVDPNYVSDAPTPSPSPTPSLIPSPKAEPKLEVKPTPAASPVPIVPPVLSAPSPDLKVLPIPEPKPVAKPRSTVEPTPSPEPELPPKPKQAKSAPKPEVKATEPPKVVKPEVTPAEKPIVPPKQAKPEVSPTIKPIASPKPIIPSPASVPSPAPAPSVKPVLPKVETAQPTTQPVKPVRSAPEVSEPEPTGKEPAKSKLSSYLDRLRQLTQPRPASSPSPVPTPSPLPIPSLSPAPSPLPTPTLPIQTPKAVTPKPVTPPRPVITPTPVATPPVKQDLPVASPAPAPSPVATPVPVPKPAKRPTASEFYERLRRSRENPTVTPTPIPDALKSVEPLETTTSPTK